MTDASELLRLAGLCEAASGPDRLLDAEIFAEQDYGAYRTGAAVPAYTASLDAAMTLVPEGMIVLVANSAVKGRKADLSRACSHVGIPDEAASYGPTDAATMPLSLCAASLRAIALTQGQNT